VKAPAEDYSFAAAAFQQPPMIERKVRADRAHFCAIGTRIYNTKVCLEGRFAPKLGFQAATWPIKP
jgi:hypothetical protein